MRLINFLFILLFACSFAAYADELPVLNGTGCLYHIETDSVSYVRPVSIYFFINTNNSLSYSGVEVDPGATALAPLTPVGNSKEMTGIYMGASPGDARPHIMGYYPADGRSQTLLVQMTTGAGACSEDYPCIWAAIGNAFNQCTALLQQQK